MGCLSSCFSRFFKKPADDDHEPILREDDGFNNFSPHYSAQNLPSGSEGSFPEIMPGTDKGYGTLDNSGDSEFDSQVKQIIDKTMAEVIDIGNIEVSLSESSENLAYKTKIEEKYSTKLSNVFKLPSDFGSSSFWMDQIMNTCVTSPGSKKGDSVQVMSDIYFMAGDFSSTDLFSEFKKHYSASLYGVECLNNCQGANPNPLLSQVTSPQVPASKVQPQLDHSFSKLIHTSQSIQFLFLSKLYAGSDPKAVAARVLEFEKLKLQAEIERNKALVRNFFPKKK